MAYKKELEFAKILALEAGEIMRRYFRSDRLGTVLKEDLTPLTVADTTINDLVIARVREMFPDHGVLGEEASFEPERQLIWVVDPIDGTSPFSCGIPVSTFSLALVDRKDGQAYVSATYDPYLDELMFATKNGGAFCGTEPLKTSRATDLAGRYVSQGSGLWSIEPTVAIGEVITQLNAADVRGFNFISAVYGARQVAKGNFVASFLLYGSPWDSAAVALLVDEAGGVASDILGYERRYDEFANGLLVSCNEAIHEKMLNIFRESATVQSNRRAAV
ncbi:inositol monophosphatase [Candidatus Saccharibacteria bacterium]|nr:MAG: inositol monophosphatase [Candidatus Saccharibacteria bacterium]